MSQATRPSGTRSPYDERMQRGALLSPILWAFVPYAVMSLLHVALLAFDNPLATPTKLSLMPLLALPVLIAAPQLRPKATIAFLLTAIGASWLGDGAASYFPAAPELPLMLGFFGIAHLAYIALFLGLLKRRRLPWWTVIYVAWWIAMIATLGPHTGGLLVAVAAYGLVLAGTAAFAARCHPLIATGGAFFLASDTLLAFQLFLPDSLPAWSSPAIMLTYTLGQGLIVGGALLALHRRSTQS